MSARFSATGQLYSRVLSLGSQSAFTVCCWARVAVNRATNSTFWELDDGTNGLRCVTHTDGVTMLIIQNGTVVVFGPVMTVGTWYSASLAISGTSGVLHTSTDAATFSTDTFTGASRTLTNLSLGGNGLDATEWLNGNVAAVKIWTSGLSDVAAENEAGQYAPITTSNLVAYYPLVNTETADYSGNGRTLSGGSGTTTESGPAIRSGEFAKSVRPRVAQVRSYHY